MIRRTFLRLAAACLIHPAFNWTQPDRVLTWDFWVPDADGTQTVWIDVSYNFFCHYKAAKIGQLGRL